MTEQRKKIETANMFFVSANGEGRIGIGPQSLTREQAINLAAWIVAIADPFGTLFEETLEAIRNT